MGEMQLTDYAIDIDQLTAEDAWNRFRELEAHRREAIGHIRASNAALRAALDRQYTLVLDRFLPLS